MTSGLVFWILMLLWAVFGIWTRWPSIKEGGIKAGGGDFLLFILLLLLGWHAFGAPIHG